MCQYGSSCWTVSLENLKIKCDNKNYECSKMVIFAISHVLGYIEIISTVQCTFQLIPSRKKNNKKK